MITNVRERYFEMLALAAVAAMAILLGYRYILDGDLYYHVANGRDILAQGALPAVDRYIWAQSERPYYPNPAWLYGVLVALLERSAGLHGIILMRTVVVVALFAGLYRLCRREGAGPLLSAGLLYLFGMISAFRFNDRPHLFSLFFFALCLLLLDERHRQEKRTLWLLPLLFALWANFHSGFVIALILLGALLVGEFVAADWQPRTPAVKRLALLLSLCTLATLLTPRPLNNLRFLAQLLEPRTFIIGEYVTPPVREFIWYYATAAALALWALWRRLQPREWAWLFPLPVFFLLGTLYARFIPYFLMGALPWTVHSVTLWRACTRERTSRIPEVGAKIAATLLCIALPLLIYYRPPMDSGLGPGADPGVAPMGSVRFLEQTRLSGRVYNSQSFGGLGAMYLYPDYRMYQGTYFQVERERIEEAARAAQAPASWLNFLDRHAIEIVWIDLSREPHTLDYYPQAQWALVYFDDFSAVYLRRHGQNPEAVATYECRVANPALLAAQIDQRSLRDPFVIANGLNEARRLLSYNPDNRQALSLIAMFLARRPGEEAAALAVLDDLQARNPAVADIYFEKGRLLARLHRYAEAEQMLTHYRKLVPDDPEGDFELASILTVTGNSERARELLQQIVDRFPEQGQAYLRLGALQLNGNELTAAWTNLSRARELLTDNAEAPNLLGIIKAQQGDMPAAIGFFRQALALAPDYESARLNLQRALRESGTIP
jgi:tetratricopeptide (TPR) repeat protein